MTDRIIVDTGKEEGKFRVVADLELCPSCKKNYVAKRMGLCLICEFIENFVKKHGRMPTKEEYDKALSWLE
ncbi:MAG: hypothetical protein KKB03_01640 [Nanoarchaeota archaeon]|nr:hypothetical protein [Nanoarchaeota archaeon]MBU1134929.1 hypothetical protein [Nanoarchaeota archaeon]MBU2519928.1 hypothetical protein [Nanoarchaeota archaeon]